METRIRQRYDEVLKTTNHHQKAIDKIKSQPLLTSTGYKVVDIPKELYKSMLWEYRQLKNYTDEYFTRDDGTIPSNSSPRSCVSFSIYYEKILKALKPLHEEWCGVGLLMNNVYGPRIYYRDAILVNHVDWHKTHVISSTITLDYDIEEPWCLVLELKDDIVEVDLKPGQMMMYEGSTVPHSRPFPLKGNYYANMYLHYKPR